MHHRMTPIHCVGETHEEHDMAARSTSCCASFSTDWKTSASDHHVIRVVIAYEPGMRRLVLGQYTATPEQAESIHGAIRGAILER